MITQQELEMEKPVVVSIDAQEFGVIIRQRLTPWEYQQYILTKLQHVGAPVEGILEKKLKYGTLCRVKESAQGPGYFDFMWVPPLWAAAINSQGGLNDGSPMGQKLEVK